jgi:hypothetical protein
LRAHHSEGSCGPTGHMAPRGGLLWMPGGWPAFCSSSPGAPRPVSSPAPAVARRSWSPPGAPRRYWTRSQRPATCRPCPVLPTGGNWTHGWAPRRATGRAVCAAAEREPRLRGGHPLKLPTGTPLSGPVTGAGGRLRRTVVTWLILPVVICLSERLSHACLGLSNYTAKLRMSHSISYSLFDSTLLLGYPW